MSFIVQQNDSLALYFDKANNDSLPFKMRLDYTKKAEGIVSSRENDSMNRVNYFKVANRYWNLQTIDEYKTVTQRIVMQAVNSSDSVSLAKAYNYKSDYFLKTNTIDSAYMYNFKAEKLYIRLKDTMNTISTILKRATLQQTIDDLVNSEKTVFLALKLLKNKQNGEEFLYQAFNLLGIIYSDFEEYDFAKKYYEKAFEMSATDKIPVYYQAKAITYNNLGILYRNQNKDEVAIKQYLQGAKEKRLFQDRPDIYSILLDNLAYSKFKVGDYSDLPEMFYHALQIRDSLNLIPGIIINKVHLSEYYVYTKDTVKALKFANEANDLAIVKFYKRDQLNTLKQLSIVDPINTLKHSTQYIKLRDSLEISDRKNSNKFARIEYETEELILEKDKLVSQRKTIIYASSSVVLLLISVLLVWYQRSKNREFQFVKQQQQANEQIYQLMFDQQQKLEEGKQIEKVRIAKELHDGIMGKLSSIRLNLFEIEKKNDPVTIAKCVDHIREIQDVEKEIKSIAYDLRNNLFSDNISFETMVKKLFTAIEHHSDIQFQLFISPNLDWEKVSSNFKIQIYRILQESLQNIDKYAQAKNVSITMKMIEELLVIEVSDDGVGFNKKKIKRGFGLTNMQERAIEIGGKVTVKSEKDKGTLISLTIPINTQS